MSPEFERARDLYYRAAATCDRTWAAYRKARERQAKKRGTFAAEQGLIDASEAVGRAQSALYEREDQLRSAALKEAERELLSTARARLPFRAPTLAEKKERMNDLVACVIRATPSVAA